LKGKVDILGKEER